MANKDEEENKAKRQVTDVSIYGDSDDPNDDGDPFQPPEEKWHFEGEDREAKVWEN